MRFFKIAALGLAALVAALAGLLLVALLRPAWFLNSRTLGAALERFGAAYQPRWGALELRVESPGLLRKVLQLEAKDFCFAKEDGSVEGCLKRLEARVEAELGSRGIKSLRVLRLRAEGDHLKVDRTKAKTSAAKSRRRPAILSKLRLEDIRAELPANEVVLSSAARILGDVSLNSAPGTPGRFDVLVAGRRVASKMSQSFRFEAGLAPDAWTLRGRAGAGSRRLTADVSAVRRASEITARLGAELRDDRGPVRRLALEDCRLRAPARPGVFPPERLELDCRFEAEPRLRFNGQRLAERLQGSVGAKAALRDRARRFDADVRLSIEPYRRWYELGGEAQAKVSGELRDLRKTLKVEHEARASLRVPQFADLVEFLRGGPYEIPAPFHVLRGPAALEVRSRGDYPRDGLEGEARLRMDLASSRQRLSLGAVSEIGLAARSAGKRPLAADVDLKFDEVALELPALSLESPPRLAVDPRIVYGRKEPAELRDVPRGSPGPSLSLRVRTSAKPIQLLSNLAKDPIPVALDLRLERPPPAVQGTVTIRSFRVELFRRMATVDHLRLIQRPGSTLTDLDGLVLYKNTEATIRILLLGTTKKPHVEFESDPPMDKEQILSGLIFGKSPSELDAEESATVGNTNAALTSQAFGLASLYLFASTPVEFVGYNPETQTYSVRLRLPGGASMELGSNTGEEESRHVRVRKRIASHWSIETELRSDQERGNMVTTFLEWFNRY